MSKIITFILIALVCLALGYFIRKYLLEWKLNKAEYLAKKILEEAQREAENKKKEAMLEAKNMLYQAKLEGEREIKEQKQELQALEKKLMQKEEMLDRKMEQLQKKEEKIEVEAKLIEEKKKEIDELVELEKKELERISGLSREEAKKIFLEKIEKEAQREAALLIKEIEEEAKREAEKKAKEIISLAIQRCATEQVIEKTVCVVDLPNNEIKGRIIGREGRNIRAFEAITGVDVIIDDTPETIILSAYDPLRREIARISIEKLISDGRIHPARIEEVVNSVRQDMERIIREIGEEAAFEVGVQGLHEEEIKLLGKLKFRTSYSQNVLQHSKEVAYLAAMMADELNLDSSLAKRAGLLHDIGKAVDKEISGSHAKIGAEIARKCGEVFEVVHAIEAHHGEVEPKTPIAILVQAADAISAARPGARRESLELYLRRLEKLEEIAKSFKGVTKAYAIQAGREVRVMVESKIVDDLEVFKLSKEIAKKIEEELEYPGQIKITVIREVRAVEYAK